MKQKAIEAAWRIGGLCQTPASTILLTGSPRSGTTWLAELLETTLRVRRVWEPFLSDVNSRDASLNFGFGWRPYLPREAEHEPLRTFCDRLLNGQVYRFPEWMGPHPHVSRRSMIGRILCPQRTLVKFCRAQRLIPWIQHRFEAPTVLLMRHPLAVVASQLHKPAFQQDGVDDLHPVLTDAIAARWPDLTAYGRSLGHFEEKLAATWAFDYLIPLQAPCDVRPDLIVTYEQLVTEPETELNRIESCLDVSFDASVWDRLQQPSATTANDSNVQQGRDRLSTWLHRLDDEQVDRILDVVETFGLDFYTPDGRFDRSAFETQYGIAAES